MNKYGKSSDYYYILFIWDCACATLFVIVFLIFRVFALGRANSSVGRASDCSSEGCWFEPGLVDIETSLTQLVECQPHELKVMGSIPT